MEKKVNIVSWRSPSNIAIVKYWGKRPIQIPQNPSISFTLKNCYTDTKVKFEESKSPKIDFYFEGSYIRPFSYRINDYIDSISQYMPWLSDYSFTIHSENSFPHSSGIASSASSMSALALCLCEIESMVFKQEYTKNELFNRASFLSRIGSGSACRSIYSKVALWGQSSVSDKSSNLYAIGLEEMLHPIFQTMHNAILIISKDQKKVSSSQGHKLMENNPYSKVRYQQAEQNCQEVFDALLKGDIEVFGKILESEAMQLHALMMCSDPSFILVEPNTIEVIQKVREFRKTNQLPLFFTLDAGPNVHLLYPDEIREKVIPFIEAELVSLCQNDYWIKDQVGLGPKKIL